MKNKNRIIFFGFCASTEQIKNLELNDSYNPISANKFSNSVGRILSKIDKNCEILGFLPASSNYKKNFIRGRKFKNGSFNVTQLPYLNGKLTKLVSRFVILFIYTSCKLLQKRFDTIVIHSIHLPYLTTCVLLKKIFNIRLHIIITDPPGEVLKGENKIIKILRKIEKSLVSFLTSYFDSAFCLSIHLKKYCNKVSNITILPGILCEDTRTFIDDLTNATKDKSGLNRIKYLYAGTINYYSGVIELVAKFKKIQNKNLKLYIFGKGEELTQLKDLIRGSKTIFYCGHVSNMNLYRLFKKIDILINPRLTDRSVSMESFPSKLIEYSYSGRTLVSTNLDCIPQELKKNMIIVDEINQNLLESVAKEVDSKNDIIRRNRLKNLIIEEYSENSTTTKFLKAINTF
ncbi:glycosyltransferase [Verrucomicrobia bacterium]|nr:glycosyltransferase [Verrucomicrobiota bacterium]